MSNDDLAHYTFVPWLRRGLADQIIEADTLAQEPMSTDAALGRAEFSVELAVGYTRTDGTPSGENKLRLEKRVKLLGPGDIIGVQARAIVRTEPQAGVDNFETNVLPYIEFYEEDFPWRYTPAAVTVDAPEGGAVDKRHKLRPWLALWVLKEGEFTVQQSPGSLPFITLNNATANQVLAPHDETWAWAHVHVSRALEDPSEINTELETDPDSALSRLLCPRKLAAETRYTAFLVPAFETGRLAGLDEDPDNCPAQQPSWVAGAMPASSLRSYDFPFYHSWEFTTGLGGDFETLVSILKVAPARDTFGKRSFDSSKPGFGLNDYAPERPLELEGALRPPSFKSASFPQNSQEAQFCEELEKVLDLSANLQTESATGFPSQHPFYEPDVPDGTSYGANVPDDPIITPPVYGQWHAGIALLADSKNDAKFEWLRDLNLDPQRRAVAGVGTEVVQQDQEQLMERAWQQIGQVNEANQRIREAQLAMHVSDSVFRKHYASLDDDRLLTLTGAAQRRLLVEVEARGETEARYVTVEREIEDSKVPLAAKSAAFKRIARPQRKLMRTLTGFDTVAAGMHNKLITRFNKDEDNNDALSTAKTKTAPSMSIPLTQVIQAVDYSVKEFEAKDAKPERLFMDLLIADLGARQNFTGVSLGDYHQVLRDAFETRAEGDAEITLDIKDKTKTLIGAIVDLPELTSEDAQVPLDPSIFTLFFGSDFKGKSSNGVLIYRSDATLTGAPGEIARMTSIDEVKQYQEDLSRFQLEVFENLTQATPPLASSNLVKDLSAGVRTALLPQASLFKRVTRLIKVLGSVCSLDQLKPVMAHPEFPEPQFVKLRARSQDYIIPNISDLPENSLTVLESNQPFIEAFMAGLNHEMARELLWREYPTDQRGTYFKKFWDTKDNLDPKDDGDLSDIRPLHEWKEALGQHATREGSYLVLVIRGELFKKYPNTVVYAQRAEFQKNNGSFDYSMPRKLSDDSDLNNIQSPVFQAELEPDVALFGFELDKDDARGHRPGLSESAATAQPGWFFVLQERPGQIKFGLDDLEGSSLPNLVSWNDITWDHLTFADIAPEHISIAQSEQSLNQKGAAEISEGTWGKTSADMAYILFQTPVLYARHAFEMLHEND